MLLSDKNNVTTHWNDVSSDYDNLMAKDKSYQIQLETIVAEISSSPKRILDLGCGTGAILEKAIKKYPDIEYFALDPASEMLNLLQKKFSTNSNIQYTVGSAHKLEFEANTFDYVVTNWALHHLAHEDKITCAREVYRILKSGGKFVHGDQFALVMGPVQSEERILHILDLLTKKAKYYLQEVSFERMLLQIKLMPRFLTENGECLATTEFWIQAMESAGFEHIRTIISEPAYLLNRVLVGTKK
ncbi:MAG: class I SAM-dependent methyltransferase [Firmicutes bacterium HGW-Firmicutes-1]|jgi:ubiquinone/menaquinone biosynthesis C-methylase UbiE|nr:MAG: class I SAM-dependent methyltransferase [Firmicutes bacterium HGW-Firmicutes-1]